MYNISSILDLYANTTGRKLTFKLKEVFTGAVEGNYSLVESPKAKMVLGEESMCDSQDLYEEESLWLPGPCFGAISGEGLVPLVAGP